MRYPSGSQWLQASHQPDGTWTLQLESGLHTYAADGTYVSNTYGSEVREDFDLRGRIIARHETNGDVITYAYAEDGTWTMTFPGGRTETHRADNTRLSETWNGVTTWFDATGSTQVGKTTLSGLTVTFLGDGSQVIDLINGWRVTISPNGTVVSAIDPANGNAPVPCTIDGGRNVSFTEGHRLEWDLTWDTMYAPGHPKSRLYADNHVECLAYDGAVLDKDTAGVVTGVRYRSGEEWTQATHASDGTWTLSFGDGTHTYAADGTYVSVTHPDGIREDFDLQGRVIARHETDGHVTTYAYYSDGTWMLTSWDGRTETHRADNTRLSETWNGVTTWFDATGNNRLSQVTLSGITVTFAGEPARTVDLPNGWRITFGSDGFPASVVDTGNSNAAVPFATDGSGQNLWLGSPASLRVGPDLSLETLCPSPSRGTLSTKTVAYFDKRTRLALD